MRGHRKACGGMQEGHGGRVRDWMWVGSRVFASNEHMLCDAKITHVLNVADNVPNYFQDSFVYCNLLVADFGADEGISRVFDDALRFCNQVRDSSGVMLVHCYAGMNRSVTIAVALLMELENLSLPAAFKEVHKGRNIAFPFQDNLRELIKHEQHLFGESSFADEHEFKQFIHRL